MSVLRTATTFDVADCIKVLNVLIIIIDRHRPLSESKIPSLNIPANKKQTLRTAMEERKGQDTPAGTRQQTTQWLYITFIFGVASRSRESLLFCELTGLVTAAAVI